jgi:hypothetical protein
MADLVIDSEDGKIPSFLVESGNGTRVPSPLHMDVGEVSSKEDPPPPNRAAEADVTMVEVDTSAAKTLEEPILPLGQGEIRRADLPPPAALEQQGMVAPSMMGGAEDIVPPEHAPEQVA